MFALGVGTTEADAQQLITAFVDICGEQQASKDTSPEPATEIELQQHGVLPQYKQNSSMEASSSNNDHSTGSTASTPVNSNHSDRSTASTSMQCNNAVSDSHGGSKSDYSHREGSCSERHGSVRSSQHSSLPSHQDSKLQSTTVRQHMSPREAYFAATTR